MNESDRSCGNSIRSRNRTQILTIKDIVILSQKRRMNNGYSCTGFR